LINTHILTYFNHDGNGSKDFFDLIVCLCYTVQVVKISWYKILAPVGAFFMQKIKTTAPKGGNTNHSIENKKLFSWHLIVFNPYFCLTP